MDNKACCTCAQLVARIHAEHDEKGEKSRIQTRTLECCKQIICGVCIDKNARFAVYCPYCQVSLTPSVFPQGLKQPPTYTPPSTSKPELPPSYEDALKSFSLSKGLSATDIEQASKEPTDDILHFLDHQNDTLTSLSLRYKVPLTVLRKANNITADHLLLARRNIIIPGQYCKSGVSLSPRPIEGEAEERRKRIVRNWMVACKVADYDVALLYLGQADYDLDAAVESYKDDETWEKEHPIAKNTKGIRKEYDLGRRRYTGRSQK